MTLVHEAFIRMNKTSACQRYQLEVKDLAPDEQLTLRSMSPSCLHDLLKEEADLFSGVWNRHFDVRDERDRLA